jgi:hypothetical protein
MARVEIRIGSEPVVGTSARPLAVAAARKTMDSAIVMIEESVDSEASHVSQPR